jgi:hypothetical protein
MVRLVRWRGRVWFATARAVAGFVDPATGAVKTIALGSGEQVANSISRAPQGTAIASDHALYLLSATRAGVSRAASRDKQPLNTGRENRDRCSETNVATRPRQRGRDRGYFPVSEIPCLVTVLALPRFGV